MAGGWELAEALCLEVLRVARIGRQGLTVSTSGSNEHLVNFTNHQLMRALRSLTVEHRQVLALTYFGELPESQIAIVLDIPLGTVQSRQSVALRHLRIAFRSEPSD